jgi:Maltokinase N-terminal cap domain
MALIHEATLRPTKLELISAWLPEREWYTGPAGDARRVASYRFDDPSGAVGIETILVRVGGGPPYQVPLTYRGEPVAGAEDRLLGTIEHSVLGTRWVYDATGDPVYAAALAGAILDNAGQAVEYTEVDGRREHREPSMSIASAAAGSDPAPAVATGDRPVDRPVELVVERVVVGDPTLIVTDAVDLAVVRRLDADVELTGVVLTGAWPGLGTPAPLAAATPRPSA